MARRKYHFLLFKYLFHYSNNSWILKHAKILVTASYNGCPNVQIKCMDSDRERETRKHRCGKYLQGKVNYGQKLQIKFGKYRMWRNKYMATLIGRSTHSLVSLWISLGQSTSITYLIFFFHISVPNHTFPPNPKFYYIHFSISN